MKNWWESKSILGSIIAVISLIASIFNFTIDAQTQGEIVEIIVIIIGLMGNIVAIYGRIKATKQIK